MTEQALDQLARRVLLDAARQEYGALIAERPEHEFSPSFERKMKKLLRRAKHPARHRFIQAAACILLAVLLTGCAVLAVSPEAREMFADWIREVSESRYLYRIHPADNMNSSPNEIGLPETIYRPIWVPAGYHVIYESHSHQHATIVYRNDSHELAVLTGAQGGVVQVDRKDTGTYTQVSIHGTPADLYIDQEEGESNILVWAEGEMVYWLSALFGEREMIKMAESMEEQGLPEMYRPTWLPDQYHALSLKLDNDGTSQIYYADDSGHSLEWSYGSIADSADRFADQEGQSVLVNSSLAELYLNQGEDGANELVWKDEEKGLLFWLHGSVTGEELIKIAESMDE